MSSCTTCGNRLSAKTKVKCRICNKEFHHSCVNLEESELPNINSGHCLWTCSECTNKIFQKSHAAVGSAKCSDEPTLNDVITLIKEMRSDQKESLKSISLLQDETTEIRNFMGKINDDLKEKESKMCYMESEINILKKENEQLKEKLNILDQNAHTNWLEISGIPVVGKEENITVTAQIICATLGFRLEDAMIDSCFRRKENSNKPNQAKTIVKFWKNRDKQELIKCRNVKKDFSTKHLKDTSLAQYVKSHEVIYVNDFLTIYSKTLLHKAKLFKKDNNIKFVWTKNGSIFMRKTEGSRIVNITSVQNFTDQI